MLDIVGKLLRWAFSRATMVVLLWTFVVGGVAAWLAFRHHFEELPAQRQTKLAELTQYRAELAEIAGRESELRSAYERKLAEVADLERAARREIEGVARSAKELNDAIAKLKGRWARIRGAFDPGVTYEIGMKERSLEEGERVRVEIESQLKTLGDEKVVLRDTHDVALVELSQERKEAREEAAIAEDEIDAIEADISKWQERLGGAQYWLGRALKLMFWSLVIATTLLIVAPFLIRAVLYYVWAPLISRARAVRILEKGTRNPRPRVSETEVAKEIVLDPGEFAIIKPRFYQASDDDLSKRTKFIFDWRYPITSLACGLVEMTRVTNDPADGVSRTLTLSSKDEAEVEIALVEIPEGGSLICRPSYLAGLIGSEGDRPRIRTHWRLFSLHAWITFQFRYFEFIGPGKLALWAVRGVRAETLEDDADRRRRTHQDATIGFTPQLAYRSARAETFWAYLRDENPLFDDLFAGKGVFLCQQVSASGSASVAGRFWSQLWGGMMRVFGL